MGQFCDRHIGELGEDELGEFELLIEVPDRDLLMWMTGEADVPSNYDLPVFRKLKAFHSHLGPLNV